MINDCRPPDAVEASQIKNHKSKNREFILMAYAKLIAFDRKLVGAAIPGQAGRHCSEVELAARDEAAYRRGIDAARALADQQMVEFRADVEQLGDGVFKKLSGLEPALLAQLRDALPTLAIEIARRLLAGYEPPAEIVSRICEEALLEIFPERDNLELVVSPRDVALLEKIKPEWLRRYPGLRMTTDPSLASGDCQVRSRFGLTDARIQTKLTAMQNSLAPV
jgi:flagellar assembly protein FliH